MKDVLVEIKDGVKAEISQEIGGFLAFCQYSPFLAGRYIGLELTLLIFTLYGFTHKKKLDWVDR